jgi:hypothetical protein
VQRAKMALAARRPQSFMFQAVRLLTAFIEANPDVRFPRPRQRFDHGFFTRGEKQERIMRKTDLFS